ncbi:MAG: type I-A CRISPR-associated protein Cas5a [candidate division WOR-3 bacterium]
MHVLGFKLLPSSLYSMRVPFTWQAAMSYPMPPPSVISGMLANVLWEAGKCAKPLEALGEVRKSVRGTWCGLVFREHKKPAISAFFGTVKTFFFDQTLTGNILPRQFLFAPDGFRVFVASEDGEFLEKVKYALQHAPVYLGDSEGLANVMNVEVVDATEEKPNGMCDVSVYFRDDLASGIDGDGGTLYWVNERAILPGEKKEPMVSYLFPVIQRGKTFRPSKLLVRFNGKAKLLKAFGEILPM